MIELTTSRLLFLVAACGFCCANAVVGKSFLRALGHINHEEKENPGDILEGIPIAEEVDLLDVLDGKENMMMVSLREEQEAIEDEEESLGIISAGSDRIEQLEMMTPRSPERNLLAYGDYHAPLDDNANLDTAPCQSISSLPGPVSGEPYIIPRGQCYVVDTTTSWDLPDGLQIEGKLYIPSTSSFDLSTTFVLVIGILKIDPPNAGNHIRVNLYGESLVTYTAPSGMLCETGCELGSKVIAVLGGQLDIRGYSSDCPSWEKLMNIFPNQDNEYDQIQVSTEAASCWGEPDTQILLTSHTRSDQDKQIVTVTDVDLQSGILTLDTPLDENTITGAQDSTFAVEVASLNRPVLFEAVSDAGDEKIGGHLMVHHTAAPQHLEGVEIRNFGQLGRLGRYPIHFHLSGDHPTSVVAKNVVRDSNQRCYVAHLTNQLTFQDNVGFNTIGHCYILEDGRETGNSFTRNLGAGVNVMDRSISDSLGRKNDNGASVFWISNAENAFYGNVAAGGENGYWFDTRGNLRKTNLIAFEDNEAHSLRVAALRTYNPGWRPTKTNVIKDLKVYRNLGMGAFIHVSQNILFQNGMFADNGEQAVFISRADNIEFDGTLFIGQSSVNPVWCRSFWDKVGISLHPRSFNEWSTNGYYSGTTLTNTEFRNWTAAETQCSPGKSRPLDFNTDDIFVPQFSAPHVFTDVLMDKDLTVNACPPTEGYGIDDIALEVESDVHRSFSSSGMPGFLVSPKVESMLPPEPGCTPYNDCLDWCEGQCLRTITVRTGDSPMPEDVQMVVSDNDSDRSITIDRGMRYNDPIHRFDAFFGVALPAGSFTASFIKQSTGETVWPGFAVPVFERAPSCGNHIVPGDFSFDIPDATRPACTNSLIYNGDFESGLDGWAQNRDVGLHVETGAGVGGSSAGETTNWKSKSYWPYQFLDTSCIQAGDVFEVEVSYQLVDVTDCSSDCPKARIWHQDWNANTGRYSYQIQETITTTVEYDSNIEFNVMAGTWTVSEDQGSADKILFYIETGSYDLIIDNVIVTKTGTVVV